MKLRLAWIATGCVMAVLALLVLAPRTSYQPGHLLRAHAHLDSNCAACHQPWHGPANQNCISCHGDITDGNSHGGVDVSDQDIGFMPGKHLAVTRLNNLSCLSCHDEHRGRKVDVNVTAAFACTFCHKHPAIGKVPEHVVPTMARKFFVRHLFKRRFNHYQHKLLVTSHYPPIAGGFACVSCHLVDPVRPGTPDRMSFKWSGCGGAGCHIAPQDNFMQMPASEGPSPITIQYSGVVSVRHINASFTHSPGHLRSACEECHFKITTSKNPVDAASLAIKQCFTCHAHQPGVAAASSADPAGHTLRAAVAYAAPSPTHRENLVTACGDCHLFHTYGVVPMKDFPNPAPKFAPNAPTPLLLTLYLPQLQRHGTAGTRELGLHAVKLAPWWIGLIAVAVVALSLFGYVWRLPPPTATQEAIAGVAPQRPREVPALDDTYQTSLRHLYIIGEAAGTASINLAMRSGRQVIEAITNELKHLSPPVQPEIYDVVIVGCGPAGLGATATAKVAGLKYVLLEKMTPASTLRSYPRAKFVQATPIDIAEYGSFFLEGDNSREELIAEWEKIIARLGLVINDREEVVDVQTEQGNFVVRTARGNLYRSRCVVLAIGVRGNPRHLDLPGENPGRVFYHLIEPAEFQDRKILVVGGGNAGAEVVEALAAPHLGNIVSYSFRAPVLTNVTRENAERISALQQAKMVTVYPASAVAEITPQTVILEPVEGKTQIGIASGAPAGPVEIQNDVTFAMIGAELPTAFLKSIGVRMINKGGWQI
jgi:thioredoxin reductase